MYEISKKKILMDNQQQNNKSQLITKGTFMIKGANVALVLICKPNKLKWQHTIDQILFKYCLNDFLKHWLQCLKSAFDISYPLNYFQIYSNLTLIYLKCLSINLLNIHETWN